MPQKLSFHITPGLLLRVGAIGLVLLLGVYLIFSQDSGILQMRKLREERDHLRDEVQRLESERDELQQQIDNLQNADPFVIEEEARRKGMIREGEEVYRLHYEVDKDSTVENEKKPQER